MKNLYSLKVPNLKKEFSFNISLREKLSMLTISILNKVYSSKNVEFSFRPSNIAISYSKYIYRTLYPPTIESNIHSFQAHVEHLKRWGIYCMMNKANISKFQRIERKNCITYYDGKQWCVLWLHAVNPEINNTKITSETPMSSEYRKHF